MIVKNKYTYTSTNKNERNSNVLITGGSGLVGKYLSKKLLENGYNVAILGRKKPQNTTNKYFWDIEKQEIEVGAVENADYIIHLAGAGIADKRWTQKRKIEIIESRTKSAELLFQTISKTNTKLKAIICASAVGYYGAVTTETIFKESDLPANDFLGKTCAKWEEKCRNFEKLNIRTVILRTGIVLTKKGGALEKMTKLIRMGIGSAIGNGKQYVPWIHIQDLCNIYIKAIEDNEIQGVYNAVAPEHITYQEFAKTIAKILNKPFFFPNVPKIVLKLIFGEMSKLLLEGSRISSEKIQKTGFKFIYPKLKNALENLLK